MVLAAFALRSERDLRRAGFGRTEMMASAGLLFLVANSTGMRFAPASVAGSMPEFVASLSATLEGERFGCGMIGLGSG